MAAQQPQPMPHPVAVRQVDLQRWKLPEPVAVIQIQEVQHLLVPVQPVALRRAPCWDLEPQVAPVAAVRSERESAEEISWGALATSPNRVDPESDSPAVAYPGVAYPGVAYPGQADKAIRKILLLPHRSRPLN